MSISLLEYAPSTQNQRVTGFEVSSEESSKIFTTESVLSPAKMDDLIVAAYRQIFHEQQMLSSNRQIGLESQLRAGQISVRGFIRGLLVSDSFRRLTFEANNNYRFAEICVQRVLGRQVYSDREKLAWSIVIATKGLNGFIDELLDSEEYISNFGFDTVPYQRRRILPQRDLGEWSFEHMARYGTDYRDRLPKPSRVFLKGGQADGLFGKDEPFEFDVFLERANWSVVSGILLLLALGVFFGLAVSASAVSPLG